MQASAFDSTLSHQPATQNASNHLTPPNDLTFEALNLAKPILSALDKAGYTHPTPIQQKAIPPLLIGQDVLLSAQTGSGKTAAFVLPILHRLAKQTNPKQNLAKHNKPKVQAVILTPTRELALQVQDNVRKYSSHLKGIFSVPLVGGADFRGQIRALTKGVQVIVATPGRFIDHLNAGRIDLSTLEVLVLDEADRMLDMGFSEDIDTILASTPSTRQTVMSSATWDGAVGKIAEQKTTQPVRVAIKVESAHIDERVYFCDDFRHKNAILHEVLNNPAIKQAVIFTATKMSSERLSGELNELGYRTRFLHGDLPQGKRNRIVSDVKLGKCQFLIATDVAARGIDIATISHVINYDLPRQPEDYVHRIGRCGRAGRTGMAVNLCSKDDRALFVAINRYLNRKMPVDTIAGLEPKHDFLAGDERKKRGKNLGFKGKHQRYTSDENHQAKSARRLSYANDIAGDEHLKSKCLPRQDMAKAQRLSQDKSSYGTRRVKPLQKGHGKLDNAPNNKTKTTSRSTRQSKNRHQSMGVHEVIFNQTAPKNRRFGTK